MNTLNALRALGKRVLAIGLLAIALAAFGQVLAGCAGNQFPLMQTTYFDLRQVTPGEIRYVANATGSAAAFVHVGTTPAQLEITNVRGPTIWVEGLLVPNPNGDPNAIPIKKQVGSEGLVFGVPDPLEFAAAAKPTDAMIGPPPEGAPPPDRVFSAAVVVLWKNAMGQDNYRPGEFDPGCLCYAALPTLRMAGTEVIPSFERQTVTFNATYRVVTSGGGS